MTGADVLVTVIVALLTALFGLMLLWVYVRGQIIEIQKTQIAQLRAQNEVSRHHAI